MNDLHIDLNERSRILKVRQRFFTYGGVAFCLIGLLTALFHQLNLQQVILSSFNFIAGLIIIIQSNPHIFKWTRCYINISADEITYKFFGIQRKTCIGWESVNALAIDFNEIYFNLKGEKNKKLKLQFISDATNKEIKRSIIGFGNEKGIKIVEKRN